VDGHARLAERVFVAFDDDALVGGEGAHVLDLGVQVLDQQHDRVAIQGAFVAEEADEGVSRAGARLAFAASPLHPGYVFVRHPTQRHHLFGRQRPHHLRQLPPELPDALAQIVGAPGIVAAPERHPWDLAGGGFGGDAVLGDVGHAPGLRAEHEHVALARLEDELLVQLADLGAPLARHQAERAAVGDRPARPDRDDPRAGQRGQAVVHPVPR
jgi:hypothetical protein